MSTVREGQNDFYLDYVTISTTRSTDQTSREISRLVTDFEIYEHLDKPYVTAKLLFVDTYNLVQRMDLQGGEKITLSIKPTESDAEAREIEKSFYIEKFDVIQSEQRRVVTLSLVEDIVFVSTTKNVNKSYTGSPISIVSTILEEYLSKDTLYTPDIYQGRMKVIVPNMHPLEAASWVKNRATTSDGLPYYLFSTLASKDLYMVDLGTMLTAPIMNKGTPYAYWQGITHSELNSRYAVVQRFQANSQHNLIDLIRKGVVGSQYKYYDTLRGTDNELNFDVGKDTFSMLIDKSYFDDNQKRFNYGPDYTIDEKPIGEYQSKTFSRISSSGAYTGVGDFKTIDQEFEFGGHKNAIIARSLKHFMTKTPVTIQVSGRDYILGTTKNPHLTIGNKIRVLVLDTLMDTGQDPEFDKKESGDYIIFAAKHIFSKERYDVQLLCTKLASYLEDPEL